MSVLESSRQNVTFLCSFTSTPNSYFAGSERLFFFFFVHDLNFSSFEIYISLRIKCHEQRKKKTRSQRSMLNLLYMNWFFVKFAVADIGRVASYLFKGTTFKSNFLVIIVACKWMQDSSSLFIVIVWSSENTHLYSIRMHYAVQIRAACWICGKTNIKKDGTFL